MTKKQASQQAHAAQSETTSTLAATGKLGKRIVTAGFIGLLIVSFAVWGLTDGSVANHNEVLIEVDDVSVTRLDFDIEWRSELQRATRQLGRAPTNEEIRNGQLRESVISRLAQRAALEAEANAMGLAVPESLLAQRLAEQTAFQGIDGKFSRDVFASTLRQSGLSESVYLDRVRSEMRHDQLVTNAIIGINTPSMRLLYTALNQRRKIATIKIEPATVTRNEPTEEELNATWNSWTQLWTRPELRKISMLELSLARLAAKETVTIADARNWFGNNPNVFDTNEQRRIRQIVVTSPEQADQLTRDLRSGKTSWKQALDTFNLTEADADLGLSSPQGILNPDLRTAAFETEKVGQPFSVNSQIGSVVAEVTEIIPGKSPSFDEVSADVMTRLRQERASDKLWDLQEIVDNAIAEGLSLQEVAEEVSELNLVTTPLIDASGNAASQLDLAELNREPNQDTNNDNVPTPEREVLRLAFAAVQNDPVGEPVTSDNNNKLTWWSVAEILPSSIKPLNQVRSDVLIRWRTDQQIAANRKHGELALTEARNAIDFSSFAEQSGREVVFSEIGDGNGNADLSAQTLQQVMEARQGETVLVPENNRIDFKLIRVTEIIDPKFDPNSDDVVALSRNVGQSFRQNLIQEYIAGLISLYPPRFNQSAIADIIADESNSLYGSNQY